MSSRTPCFDYPSYICRRWIEIEKAPVGASQWPVRAPQRVTEQAPGPDHEIFHLALPYAQGTGFDIGCRGMTCLPHMIGVECGAGAGPVRAADVLQSPAFQACEDASLDFIYSCNLLQRIARADLSAVLAHWAEKLRFGGHLLLPFAVSGNVRSEEAVRSSARNVEKALRGKGSGCGWIKVEQEERSTTGGHILFDVYRKTRSGFARQLWQRNPGGKKRCVVARWGAIGDYVVAGSAMKGLQEQGYHVAVCTNSLGEQILRNNPYIDEFVIVENGSMDREQYDDYFRRIRERYDKVVDLDDSLEGLMVARAHQKAYWYPRGARRFIFDKNYQELVHHISGTPLDIRDSYFPDDSEIQWAMEGRAFMARSEPCVAWAISGSAIHKVYPWIDVVARWLAAAKVHLFLMGGHDMSVELQKGILKTLEEDGADGDYIHPCVGIWDIRESLSFARRTDCIVGPETGLMHGVAMTSVPKVIYLSHSGPENLTKHWVNTTTLVPDSDRCPCYPCHRMHNWWDTCNKDEEQQVARCASSIAPEVVFEAIMTALRTPR